MLNVLSERYELPMMIVENGIGLHEEPAEDGMVHDDERIQYFHNHKEASSQARQLCTYDQISFADSFEQISQGALVVGLLAGDGFLNPPVNGKSMRLTKTGNLKFLIPGGLSICAHPDVTVIHS